MTNKHYAENLKWYAKSGRFVQILQRARKEAERSGANDSVSQWLRADPAAVEEATYVVLSLYLGLDKCGSGPAASTTHFCTAGCCTIRSGMWTFAEEC